MIGVKTYLLPEKAHKNRAKNTKFFCHLLDTEVSGSPVAVPGYGIFIENMLDAAA